MKSNLPYVHGFSPTEQKRLRKQAAFAEFKVYQNIDFSETTQLLEVGCGVGAQSEILLRRFPQLHLTGIDLNGAQLSACEEYLSQFEYAKGRYEIKKMNAAQLDWNTRKFDGAFLCWILEHVKDPQRVLSEVRRILQPGSPIFITEVSNSSFFLDPYSPHVWKYWMAFNDFQYENAGDPFIGAKLGNLLMRQGYTQIETEIKTWHYDNREPHKRKTAIEYWKELLLSAADQLKDAGAVTEELIQLVKEEFDLVAGNPDAVFFYSFVQAKARV